MRGLYRLRIPLALILWLAAVVAAPAQYRLPRYPNIGGTPRVIRNPWEPAPLYPSPLNTLGRSLYPGNRVPDPFRGLPQQHRLRNGIPGVSSPSPVQLLEADLLRAMRINPADTLLNLHRNQDAWRLPGDRHASLVRQTLDKLTTRVGGSTDPLAMLREIQGLRLPQPSGLRLGTDVEVRLRGLELRAERQRLAQGLRAVEQLRSRQWNQAGHSAREWLRGDDGLKASPLAAERKQVRQQLEAVREVAASPEARRAAGAARFEAALKVSGEDRPAEASRLLRQVPAQDLPADLQPSLRGLAALEELRAALTLPAREVPDAEALGRSLADFRSGFTTADGGTNVETLAGQLRQELAVKAFLEGHASQARALLSAGGPPEHAAKLLRDIRVLFAGKGEVQTDPARGLLAGSGGKGGPPRRPPETLEGFFPEDWNPGAGGGEPSPREQAVRLGRKLRDTLQPRLAREQAAVASLLQARLTPQDTPKEKKPTDEDSEEKKLAEVSRLVSFPLTAAGREEARRLLRTGKTPAEVARILTSR